jgi:hypothetical protein
LANLGPVQRGGKKIKPMGAAVTTKFTKETMTKMKIIPAFTEKTGQSTWFPSLRCLLLYLFRAFSLLLKKLIFINLSLYMEFENIFSSSNASAVVRF